MKIHPTPQPPSPPAPSSPATGTFRTTVSLTPVVAGWARELMEADGYDNFSAFIAELIRTRRRAVPPQETPAPPPSSTAPAAPSAPPHTQPDAALRRFAQRQARGK